MEDVINNPINPFYFVAPNLKLTAVESYNDIRQKIEQFQVLVDKNLVSE